MTNPLYALILAGGSGERFWPLSRRARPKQLLKLVSDKTLLEETIDASRGLGAGRTDPGPDQRRPGSRRAGIAARLPPENIVAEPAKRDTAAAVALATAWVAARDHRATMMVLPADHVIKDRAAFQKTMQTAARAAEETGALVTIGIKPTWACPGFGYIEQGAPAPLRGGSTPNDIFRVVRFREKPNAELADSFVRRGNFRWNAGHVRLVGADGPERVQSPRAGAGGFHFANPRARELGARVAAIASPSCRSSLSTTRSWKKPIAC